MNLNGNQCRNWKKTNMIIVTIAETIAVELWNKMVYANRTSHSEIRATFKR